MVLWNACVKLTVSCEITLKWFMRDSWKVNLAPDAQTRQFWERLDYRDFNEWWHVFETNVNYSQPSSGFCAQVRFRLE